MNHYLIDDGDENNVLILTKELLPVCYSECITALLKKYGVKFDQKDECYDGGKAKAYDKDEFGCEYFLVKDIDKAEPWQKNSSLGLQGVIFNKFPDAVAHLIRFLDKEQMKGGAIMLKELVCFKVIFACSSDKKIAKKLGYLIRCVYSVPFPLSQNDEFRGMVNFYTNKSKGQDIAIK